VSWLASWTWTWWGYSRSGWCPRLGWRPRLDGGLFLCWGSRSGGVRGRIQVWGGRRGYRVHGPGQKSGGLAVNMDLMKMLVGLQEGE
jgi:hypothetical protein